MAFEKYRCGGGESLHLGGNEQVAIDEVVSAGNGMLS
jgi:hypothetical protein